MKIYTLRSALLWSAVGLNILAVIFACQETEPRERRVLRSVETDSDDSSKPADQDPTEEEKSPENPPVNENNQADNILFSWEPGDNQVYEYQLLVGPSSDNLTLFKSYRQVKDVFDMSKPAVSIPKADLNYQQGQNLCFQVIAINVQGLSPPSAPVCLN